MKLSRWILGAVVVVIIVVSVTVAVSTKADKARIGKPVHIHPTGPVASEQAPPASDADSDSPPGQVGAPRVTKAPPVAGDDDDPDDDDYYDDDDREDDAHADD